MSSTAKPSTCCACFNTMHPPPPVKTILSQWPDVVPDFELDRTIPRCRYCDLAIAKLNFKVAVAHTAKSPAMGDIRICIEDTPDPDDIMADDMSRRCMESWERATRYQRAGAFLAVLPYFAIWGKVDETGEIHWVSMPRLP